MNTDSTEEAVAIIAANLAKLENLPQIALGEILTYTRTTNETQALKSLGDFDESIALLNGLAHELKVVSRQLRSHHLREKDYLKTLESEKEGMKKRERELAKRERELKKSERKLLNEAKKLAAADPPAKPKKKKGSKKEPVTPAEDDSSDTGSSNGSTVLGETQGRGSSDSHHAPAEGEGASGAQAPGAAS
jgi:hypothetical protein